jgi:hypothetical protein
MNSKGCYYVAPPYLLLRPLYLLLRQGRPVDYFGMFLHYGQHLKLPLVKVIVKQGA